MARHKWSNRHAWEEAELIAGQCWAFTESFPDLGLPEKCENGYEPVKPFTDVLRQS